MCELVSIRVCDLECSPPIKSWQGSGGQARRWDELCFTKSFQSALQQANMKNKASIWCSMRVKEDRILPVLWSVLTLKMWFAKLTMFEGIFDQLENQKCIMCTTILTNSLWARSQDLHHPWCSCDGCFALMVSWKQITQIVHYPPLTSWDWIRSANPLISIISFEKPPLLTSDLGISI